MTTHGAELSEAGGERDGAERSAGWMAVMTKRTHDQTFSVAKARLRSARQALLDAASLLREIGLKAGAERCERLADQIQQFPSSHAEIN